MTWSLAPLDRLNPTLRTVVQRLDASFPAEVTSLLESWVLFGVAAGPGFDPARHRATSVLVWKRVDLPALRLLARKQGAWQESGFAIPLIMTPGFLAESCDSFPLELLEIQQQRLVLGGTDPFAPLTFCDEDVRLQAERELKGMLVAMRQRLLAVHGDRGELDVSLDRAAEGIVRILRGLLWLRGVRQPRWPDFLVEEIERRLKRPLPGVRSTLATGSPHGWEAYVALYDDLLLLSRSSDVW